MQFAAQYLNQYRFLYRDSDGEQKVCHHNADHHNVSNDPQKWKGLFGGPFIIKTFAAHLSAIDGCIQVPDLQDTPYTDLNVVGALGMAAASVCALCVHTCRVSDYV